MMDLKTFFQALRQECHPLIDHTTVDLYASSAWSTNGHSIQPLPDATTERPAISLIATVWNEGETIEAWLETLLAQTCRPTEIVIVDGGSTDGTFEALQAFAAHSPVPIKVWQAKGANIARGRNLAIEQAAGPIIAATDAGCQVPTDWLATITAPFAVDPNLDVAAGYYEAIQRSDLQRIMAAYLVTPAEMVTPQSFLPSSRSIAFRKAAWQAAGGYPEWLTLTAEDTLFDLALKQHTHRWAFVPEAKVRWYLKSSLPQLFRQVRNYGRGDGEAGLFPTRYGGFSGFLTDLGLSLLGGLLCLILAVVFRNWLWLLGGLVLAARLARRLRRETLRPKLRPDETPLQKLTTFGWSLAVLCTINLAQVVGYVEGVQRRITGNT